MQGILAMGGWQLLTTAIFVIICILLIIVILLQKGRGGGLAGAFGGAGGHSAFGAKTGDVFTWVTIALTAMFILVAVVGNFVYRPDTPPTNTTSIGPAGPTGAANEAGEETGGESGGEAGGEEAAPAEAPTTQP